jgi:hypothetical protein
MAWFDSDNRDQVQMSDPQRVSSKLSTLIFFILGFIATIVLWGLATAALYYFIGPVSPSERNALALTSLQILAGAFLILGAVTAWRTLHINRQSVIEQRFLQALQLIGATDPTGKKLIETRIGGIYALQKIAISSPKDFWTITEILTAYIRVNAPWPTTQELSTPAGTQQRWPNPAADIQACIDVLKRTTIYYGIDKRHWALNLNHTDLRNTDLRRFELFHTYLRESNLEGARLEHAILRKTRLEGANLERANLAEAVLDDVSLKGANLKDTIFRDTTLKDVNLENVHNYTSEQREEVKPS